MADHTEAFAKAQKGDSDSSGQSAEAGNKSYNEVSTYLQDLAQNDPNHYRQAMNFIFGRVTGDSSSQPPAGDKPSASPVAAQQHSSETADKAQTEQAPLKYQVAAGDSLWGIADRFMQHNSSTQPSNAEISNEVQRLKADNHIANPDQIAFGSTLVINLPGDKSAASQNAEHKPGNAPEQNNGQQKQDKAPTPAHSDSGQDLAQYDPNQAQHSIETKDKAQTEQAPLKYQVAANDSLWGIADHVMHHNSSAQPSDTEISDEVHRLTVDNHIQNPDQIAVGSTLVVNLPGDGSSGSPKTDHDSGNAPEQKNDQQKQDKAPTPAHADSVTQKQDWLDAASVQSKQQTGWTCSIASMQMALATYRLRNPGPAAQHDLLSEVVNERRINQIDGFLGGAPEMANELNKRGLQAQGTITTNIADLDNVLGKGHTAIVNGGFLNYSDGSVSGHFIFARDRDASGGYEVNDPVSNSAEHWSKARMNTFLTRPGHGSRGVVDIWK